MSLALDIHIADSLKIVIKTNPYMQRKSGLHIALEKMGL